MATQEWPNPWQPEEEIYPRSLRDEPKKAAPTVDVWHLVRFAVLTVYLSLIPICIGVGIATNSDIWFAIGIGLFFVPIGLLLVGMMIWILWDFTGDT